MYLVSTTDMKISEFHTTWTGKTTRKSENPKSDFKVFQRERMRMTQLSMACAMADLLRRLKVVITWVFNGIYSSTTMKPLL